MCDMFPSFCSPMLTCWASRAGTSLRLIQSGPGTAVTATRRVTRCSNAFVSGVGFAQSALLSSGPCTAQEALQCAVAENPLLAQQYPELAAVVAKGEAAALKERGNAAFAAKRRAYYNTGACSAWAGGTYSSAAGTGTRMRPQRSQSALRWTPRTRSTSATVPRRSLHCGGIWRRWRMAKWR